MRVLDCAVAFEVLFAAVGPEEAGAKFPDRLFWRDERFEQV